MRNPGYVKELAKKMRKKPTPAEAKLWEALRGKRFDGVKFYRQRPLDRYILEFYAPMVKLVIEVDGDIHDTPGQKENDRLRTIYLESKGLKVIRFRNEQILNDIEYCLAEIQRVVLERKTGEGSD